MVHVDNKYDRFNASNKEQLNSGKTLHHVATRKRLLKGTSHNKEKERIY